MEKKFEEGRKERGWQEVKMQQQLSDYCLHVETSFGLGLCTQVH